MAFDWKKMKLSKDSKIRKEMQGFLGSVEKGKPVKGKKGKQDDFLSAFDEKIKKKNEEFFG